MVDRLEPLTRQHYDDFATCDGCGQVYWNGSHHRRLEALVETIVGELAITSHATATSSTPEAAPP